jgi:hypothetical protein
MAKKEWLRAHLSSVKFDMGNIDLIDFNFYNRLKGAISCLKASVLQHYVLLKGNQVVDVILSRVGKPNSGLINRRWLNGRIISDWEKCS